VLPGPVPRFTPPGPRIDRTRTIVFAAIAVVLAVIIGVLISENSGGRPLADAFRNRSSSSADSATDSSDSATDSSDSSGSGGTTTTTAPQDLDAVVLDIEQFVERERGLKFKQRVHPVLAGEGEFQQKLLADFDKERPGLQEMQEVLTALGLVPPGTDVVAAERSLLDIGVVGFYDPESKQLVVRGTTITPYVREVLAHELTHALDDQWFDLNRPQYDNPDDDSSFGFLGLVEGNARRVEDAYLASLTLDEQRSAFTEEENLVAQHPEVFDLPQILLNLLQAPYDDGPVFVDQVLADGGQQKLDATFVTPPVTSEQILHPDRFLKGDVPVDVPQPAADREQHNIGVLGELQLRELLFDSIASAAQVNRAVTGWGGDKYVTWTDDTGRACLRDTFVGDTPTDTIELTQSIQEWAQDHGATVDAPGGGPATFTVCS